MEPLALAGIGAAGASAGAAPEGSLPPDVNMTWSITSPGASGAML
jgi:hypothetical protein